MEYVRTAVANAFGAPVFRVTETDTTMEDAKILAARGEADGTAVFADFQRRGRGRIEGRSWESRIGDNLLCTVILRRKASPGFTLQVGLAVARTFDSFLPEGAVTAIKWPNDVLFRGKKLSGILCENAGDIIAIGTGFNIGSRAFPEEISLKATSLALILDEKGLSVPSREEVLERYLENLKRALIDDRWREAVSEKLYRRGERIDFLSGDPGRHELITGVIEGIDASGELLFRPDEKERAGETGILRLFSGEFPY